MLSVSRMLFSSRMLFKARKLPDGAITRRADGDYQKVGGKWVKILTEHERLKDPEHFEAHGRRLFDGLVQELDAETRDLIVSQPEAHDDVLEDAYSLLHATVSRTTFWREWKRHYQDDPDPLHKKLVEGVAHGLKAHAEAMENAKARGQMAPQLPPIEIAPKRPAAEGVPPAKGITPAPLESFNQAQVSRSASQAIAQKITIQPKLRAGDSIAHRKGTISPSDNMPLAQLKRIRDGHYIGADGQEYVAEEVDKRILDLETKQANQDRLAAEAKQHAQHRKAEIEDLKRKGFKAGSLDESLKLGKLGYKAEKDSYLGWTRYTDAMGDLVAVEDETHEGDLGLFLYKPEALQKRAVYFAYGSNMHSKRLGDRIGREVSGKPAVLGGWQLRNNKIGGKGNSYMNIEEHPNYNTHGVAFLLTENELKELDRYEGAPEQYRQKKVSVMLDGQKVDAITYVGNEPHLSKEDKPAKPEYAKLCLDGAKEHGLPAHHQEKMKDALEGANKPKSTEFVIKRDGTEKPTDVLGWEQRTDKKTGDTDYYAIRRDGTKLRAKDASHYFSLAEPEAPVGAIHRWKGGLYRKVSDGYWEKVTDPEAATAIVGKLQGILQTSKDPRELLVARGILNAFSQGIPPERFGIWEPGRFDATLKLIGEYVKEQDIPEDEKSVENYVLGAPYNAGLEAERMLKNLPSIKESGQLSASDYLALENTVAAFRELKTKGSMVVNAVMSVTPASWFHYVVDLVKHGSIPSAPGLISDFIKKEADDRREGYKVSAAVARLEAKKEEPREIEAAVVRLETAKNKAEGSDIPPDVALLPEVPLSELPKLKGRTPSVYQAALFKFIKHGKGNAVVEAVAGSGKTTSIEAAFDLIPESERGQARFVSFNKHIQKEMEERGLPARTMHSEGYAAWRKAVGNVSQLDGSKCSNIFREMTANQRHIFSTYRNVVRSLVDKAKLHGLVPERAERELGCKGIMQDRPENWEYLMDAYDIDAPSEGSATDAIQFARAVLFESLRRKNEIDFADMLYMPIAYNVNMPKYKWFFLDEVQDLNDLQHALVERMIAPGGRMVAVGDSRQSIYAFAGANPDSMNKLKKRMHATAIPLSICYRCGKKMVEKAKAIVPQIEAAPNAIEGEIKELGTNFKEEDFTRSDLIICRNNAPLVGLTYRILRKRIPCKMLGRSISDGLAGLIDSLKPKDMGDLKKQLEKWQVKQIEKVARKDPEGDISHITDRYETLMTFIEECSSQTPEALKAEIQEMFSDENTKGILRLSSIHKAKGSEADNVYILNSSLMDKARARAKTSIQKQQEDNIRYVAYTRPKKMLGFIETANEGMEQPITAEEWLERHQAMGLKKARRSAPPKLRVVVNFGVLKRRARGR